MRTLSCLSQLLRRLPPAPTNRSGGRSRGQVLVIFAVSLVALLLFIGLAVDAGIAYVSYGQLKRAVDSAAVAAAVNFKRGFNENDMRNAVIEVLQMHNVAFSNLTVQICDDDNNGFRDDSAHMSAFTGDDLSVIAPKFLALCPVTNPNPSAGAASPRKLVWVQADQQTPFYFLTLLGINHINLETNAMAEAAAIDLVLVIDTSESMASECEPGWKVGGVCTPGHYRSPNYGPTSWDDYEPSMCGPNDCHPLEEAKDAADALLDNLYVGYDAVSVITFATNANYINIHGTTDAFTLQPVTNANRANLKQSIQDIQLNDDTPLGRMWYKWRYYGRYNPANPEDRDGDGNDNDPMAPCTLDADFWDEALNAPCDDDNKFDAFDWNMSGAYEQEDTDLANIWWGLHFSFALPSTCTGCGMRLASNQLRDNGRPGAVWVVIFLSDGAANMSDTPFTAGTEVIPAVYGNGFCTERFWTDNCFDYDPSPRYCLDTTSTTCPPGSVWEVQNRTTSHYSVLDYAYDMVDTAALTVNRTATTDCAHPGGFNCSEPLGNDIAIYSIGLGDDVEYGEPLLRYMAQVGDDGDRTTNPCSTTAARQSCGQYYFAATGDALRPIFLDIATRIYTRITQ